MDNIKDYITVTQAANKLGVSRERVHQFIKKRRLKPILLGNIYVFHKQLIEDFAKIDRPDGRPKLN